MSLYLGRLPSEFLPTLSIFEQKLLLAHYQLNPWDETRADIRHEILCRLLASVNGVDSTDINFTPDYRAGDESPEVVDENIERAKQLDAILKLIDKG